MDALQAGLFEGRSVFVASLRQALIQACAEGRPALYCFDQSLVDWPLSEPEVLAALTTWARPHRRLHLLAGQFDELRVRQPRFVRWRGSWGHCVQALAYTPEALAAAGPRGALAAAFFAGADQQTLSLSLFDKKLWRGNISLDGEDFSQNRLWFDALAQRSSESFAVTTLGL